jgi:phosphoribosylanthranilate isomerase
MNLPQFITFTGADDHTSIDGMHELSRLYPIEWGILFSPKRQGSGRYPSIEFVHRLIERSNGMVLAAHLCGSLAREIVSFGQLSAMSMTKMLRDHFQRAQVNTADPTVQSSVIRDWGFMAQVEPILQCRSEFPMEPNVAWLFDASGGRGIAPAAWPFARYSAMCGYAGGLNPANVALAVADISTRTQGTRYWIDMESGVRDEGDRFDLERCRLICETIYGQRS